MSDTSTMFFHPTSKHFYDFRINDDVIEISLLSFRNISDELRNGAILKVNSEGKPYTVKRKIPVVTLDDTFKLALSTLNGTYETVCTSIRGTYPETETGTWPVQLVEALEYKRWVKEGSVEEDRPIFILLDPLAKERDDRDVGDGLADLVDRIINNAMFYNTAIAKATAIRHQTEQRIIAKYNSNDIEGILAIPVDFSDVYTYLGSLGILT